ncbi:hypothetical protein SDC9_163460 [bioreactor metagenome]|uniref:Uncharacterized protein n=1 Tax=bioreactor metagenome TaxID=1076179 RepID=A0A645FR79_9ZZZZ
MQRPLQCWRRVKKRVQTLFQLTVIFRLRKAVVRRLAGMDLPRRRNSRFFALNNNFLVFTVMHHRGGQLRQRPVWVFENSRAKIFDFGVVVGDVGHHRHHFRWEAEHPLNGVDVVHRVIQRAAAAFLLPRAAPPQIVITVSAPPERIHLRMANLARQPGINHGFQTPEGIGKAVLGDDR